MNLGREGFCLWEVVSGSATFPRSCRVCLSFMNLGREGFCLWVVVSGSATFPTVVDRPTPSSSRVPFMKIVDAVAAE